MKLIRNLQLLFGERILRLGVVFLAVAVTVTVVNSYRTRCERVLSYPSDVTWRFETAHNNRIYMSNQSHRGVTIRTYPGGGGQAAVIAQELPRSSNGDRMYDFTVQRDRVFYVIESSAMANKASPSQPIPRRRRGRMLRLSGGIPETVLEEVGDASIDFGANSAFVVVPRSPVVRNAPVPTRDLWLQALPKGARRRIGVVPRGAPLTVGRGGVTYLVETPENRSLVYIREADGEIRHYDNFRAITWLAVEDGLVWIQDTLTPGGIRRAVVFAGNTGDPATLSEWPVGKDSRGVLLVDKRGAEIYYLTSRVSPGGIVTSSARASFWRLRLTGNSKPELLTQLPVGAYGPGVIDNDYFYFDCREPRENWLDWSTDGLSPRYVASIQRFRIPPALP